MCRSLDLCQLIFGFTNIIHTFMASPRRQLLNPSRVAAEVLVVSKLPAFAAADPDIHVEPSVEDPFSDIVGSGYDAGARPGDCFIRI
jgi:DNA-binding transcriptional LysR family regulator